MVGDVVACWWAVGGVVASRQWAVGRHACEGSGVQLWVMVKVHFGPLLLNCSNRTPIESKLIILCNYTLVRILNISLDFALLFILVLDF